MRFVKRRKSGLANRRTKSEYDEVTKATLLGSKSRVQYFDLPIRSVLNRSRSAYLPFRWTINPYRGCEFGCKYCYARYTHEFMGMEDPRDFEDKIFAKAGAGAALREELRGTPRADAIAIGTATDPYQPAEFSYRRTREILDVFAAEKGRRLSITTKSCLIERDLELLRRVARANVLSVNMTITTLDVGLARALEPRAPRPSLRLRTVAALAEAGIQAGVFSNPILPLITDSRANLDSLAQAAAAAGARHFGGGVLFLMPCAQKVFFPFLEERFPQFASRYRERYERSPYLRGEYCRMIRNRVDRIRLRHGLSAAAPEYSPELWEGDEQGTLFPLN